jgi:hypothetical protein
MRRRAEIVAFGDYDRVGVQTDWERATARLERLGYDDGGEALWRYALALVRQHQPLIVRLAMKLRRAGELDGAAIDRIVFRG